MFDVQGLTWLGETGAAVALGLSALGMVLWCHGWIASERPLWPLDGIARRVSSVDRRAAGARMGQVTILAARRRGLFGTRRRQPRVVSADCWLITRKSA